MRFAMPRPTRLAMTLIVVNLAIFLLQSFTSPRAFSAWGGLTFENGIAFWQPWRWITYQYLHGGGMHIFFNCLGIFFFLPPLERRWGWAKTLAFYTAGGIFAGVVYGFIDALGPVSSNLIGASGSILAALGACALLFPEMQIVLLLFLVPIRLAAALFGLLYFLTIIGDRDLSNAAHLGGLAFGFLAPWLLGNWWYRMTHNVQVRHMRRAAQQEEHEQEEVDRILQKVHDYGMHSLAWRERRLLRKATERQRQRDLEVSRRRIL